jgi:nicotinate dehydrogenase subunit B
LIANTLPRSLVDNPVLGTWIGFEEEGRVRLSTGKVELGQGILTALAQIAAEELDVCLGQIRIVSGDTAASPSEGFTSGSNSTEVSGGAVRLVCAEVRHLFLREAAAALGCGAGELTVEAGRFLRAGEPTGHDYWSLTEKVDLGVEVRGDCMVKKPSEYRIVGRSMPRTDLPEKMGGAPFIHDMAADNLLHARVLHRPWRGTRLTGLDEPAVRKAAGAPVDLLRNGDFLAFIADDETAAMRAHAVARHLAVWEGGERIPAEADQAAWLMSQPSRDRVLEFTMAGPAQDGKTFEALYSRPYLVHASIAPACALAEYRDGDLTVWTHSQGVFSLRQWLAHSLQVEAARISVRHRQGAGCYGHNAADDAAFEAAFIALRRPGRTVRVQWAREDELAAAPLGPAMAVRLQARLDEQARPAEWTIEIWSPIHGRRPGMNGAANFDAAEALSEPPPLPERLEDVPCEAGGGATRNGQALYDLPRSRLIHHLLPGVPVRTSTLRALGAHLNVFAIESFMDELAEIAGEDPVSYRLAITSDPRARRVMEEAAEMSAWFTAEGAGEGRALGFGFARYKNRAAYVAAIGEVEVEAEVRVLRVWCAVDAGLVINPDGAANQIEGGVIQALSWGLKEQVRFEEGRIVSDSWESYPILRFTEAPEVEVRFIEAPNLPILGIGEASIGPTAAAVGNAVSCALGARIRDLPLSRERLMAALLA